MSFKGGNNKMKRLNENKKELLKNLTLAFFKRALLDLYYVYQREKEDKNETEDLDKEFEEMLDGYIKKIKKLGLTEEDLYDFDFDNLPEVIVKKIKQNLN